MLLLWSSGLHAAACRYYFAHQYDWSGQRGFTLGLEADAGDGAVCTTGQTAIVLGVADGSAWRFIQHTPGWEMGRTYKLQAVIGTDAFSLWLDGVEVARGQGGFLPLNGPLYAQDVPSWADGPAAYLATEDTLRVEAGDKVLDVALGSFGIPPEVMLFQAGQARNFEWPSPAGQPLTVTVTFRLLPRADLRASSPFIDRYGQSRHAAWPGKIAGDGELLAANREEQDRLAAAGVPPAIDAGWKEAATGFYRVVQRNGFWWLITPGGDPCFYTGVATAPALYWDMTPVTGREFLFEELPPRDADPFVWARDVWGGEPQVDYAALHTPVLMRRYGAGWQSVSGDLLMRRLRTWGFTGLGKWSEATGDLPITPVLYYTAPRLVDHPDVFDPAVQALIRESLRAQIEPRKEDARVVGWSVGSEMDGIVTAAETAGILILGAGVAAKRAFVDEALASLYRGDVGAMSRAWNVSAARLEDLYAAAPAPPAGDLEALRRFYEGRYHKFLYETVKAIDPNHLYLGFWIVPGWWENEADWSVTAPYCDVIGYDRYAPTLTDSLLERLLSETGKPVLLGEFSFPPAYGLARGFGLYSNANSTTDAAAGEAYAAIVLEAARHPQFIGAMWFQYRDQPLTGRGPGSGEGLVYGEHYAFGLVDGTDRPKWDMVERMRAANLAALPARLAASR
jgi:hypothetical protein